ncbi:hypothetical protein KJ641_01305 [Patescibacteria group bacterium]|nr:hypothetical protein [Patescibacteria group bacterium]MBU1895488.1 hypothetical protein [Patescibacteria group bacterium]
MEKKVCTKCKLEKPSEVFNWKDRKKALRNSLCKECHGQYRKDHYQRNKEKYILKARRWNSNQTQVLRKIIINYLERHHCVDCGNSDIRVLDFDHGEEKYMGISQMVRNCYSVTKVENEISKCRVRCSNCHRIKTFKKGNFWKNKMGP